ncbi:MAG: hypothetical protein AAF764_04945 [Pseudomonadota bacterium]
MAEPSIHASALVLGAVGLLLRGPSGSGKSMLGHHLIAAHRAAGRHAVWVADDRVRLDLADGRIIARPVEELAGLAEFRGLDVQPVHHMENAVIDMIVDLTGSGDRIPKPMNHRLLPNGPELPLIRVPAQNLGVATILIAQAMRPSV